MANATNDSENSNSYDCQKNIAKMPDLDLDLDRDLNSSGFAERKAEDSPPSPKIKKSKKPYSKQKSKKLPLRERELVNDMERVEKAYLQNWDSLFSQGVVKTPDPVIIWGQTRAQLKSYFEPDDPSERIEPELIIQAINDGAKDDWVLDKGYSLGIMLSAKVLNRLINSRNTEPPRHRIAADNVSQEKVSSYFKEAK
jgi:hypothetical protein